MTRSSRCGFATLIAVVALSAGSARAGAQLPSTPTPAQPSFEVASIRPARGGAIDIRFFPDRFVATTVTLSQLIEQAYGLEARELVGGPDWVRMDRFNVTATAGEPVDRNRMKLMLQSLIADRFQLQVAPETQTGTVYTLTARNVHDLRPPAKPDERPRIALMREDSKGFLSYHYDGYSATMAMLAQEVAAQLRAPVTDQTNLTGAYDFRINWALDSPFGGLEPDPNVPTISTALEQQVGLKLIAGRGPVPVNVIKKVEKPSEN